MSASGVEIIDLTDSLPQSPALPATSVHVRALRKQKRARSDTTSATNSPINISDGDEASSTPGPSSPKKRRKVKKKKEKMTQLEEGEVADEGVGQGTGNSNEPRLNGRTVSDALRSKSRLATDVTTPNSSSPPLFYLDDKPDVPPADVIDASTTSDLTKPDSLLLPDHVILDAVPRTKEAVVVTTTSTEVESDTDDFIHYADAELNLFTRYYEEPKDESERKAHLVCGQCGAEGDHKRADCPVVVCLTCGAHNEHSTRQCPIVKTCFACGMKGHINRDCPNKHASRRLMDRDYDCSRCGSYLHRTRECPTLWRMYEYVDDAEREAILKSRREKENFPIGQGGEGYIGEDYWCYNCGGEGHLGDDCEVEAWNPDSKEPSAFGSFNIMSGPFADREHSRSEGRKFRREWELNGNFDDGHGFAGPSDVGKRGRDKERDRMRRREKEMQDFDDDEEDWFGGRLHSISGSCGLSLGTERKKVVKEAIFKFRNGDKTDKDSRRPADRLLDRISLGGTDRDSERTRDRRRERSVSPRDHHGYGYHGSDSRSKRGQERESERKRRRDRDRDRERELSYQGSSRKPYRSSRENGKGNEERSGCQYYGDYAR